MLKARAAIQTDFGLGWSIGKKTKCSKDICYSLAPSDKQPTKFCCKGNGSAGGKEADHEPVCALAAVKANSTPSLH